jgi:serine/threonine protein kinase
MWNLFGKNKAASNQHDPSNHSKDDDVDLLKYKVGDSIGGDYLIKDIFGGHQKSGMGVVYLVEHRQHEKPLVLKTFQQVKAATSLSEQFRKEVAVWVSVGVHPNIVKAISVDVIDFRLFVAAEYINRDESGRNNVRDYIAYGAINPFWILNWTAQFCYAMKYAQQRGLKSHRDVKPENLMIDQSMNLKVTDFGLAILLGDNKSVPAGTLPYMAPEQIVSMSAMDHRSDIYAWGVVMYQMFTGGGYPYEISYKTDNLQVEYANAHLRQSPRKLNSPINRIVERCLKKDIKIRYQSYDELLGDVAAVALEMGLNLPGEIKRRADDESEELYVQAQAAGRLGDNKKAYELINQYVQKYPEKSSGWTEKGRILYELDRIQESEEAFLKSLELFPYSSAVWNNLGLLYSKTRRYDAAIGALSRSLEFDTGNSGALMNMARVYLGAGRYRECTTTYLGALKKYPGKETLVVNAGYAVNDLLKANAIKESIEILKVLTKIKPLESDYWHNLALCYWKTREIDSAQQCFIKVVDINPADQFAWLTLAKLSAESGRVEQALIYCDRAIALPTGEVPGSVYKAQLLEHKGLYDEAVRCIKKSMLSHPEEDSPYFVWATIALRNGRKSDALEAARRCKQILANKHKRPNPENIKMLDEIIARATGDAE